MKKSLPYIVVLSLLLPVFTVTVHADVSLVNQYDPNGSLVSGDGKYYEYNDANQLVRVRENDQNGKVIAEYFYDYTGQRVKKVENGVTTYYIGKHYETNVVAGKADNTSYFFADGERVAKKDSTGTYFFHPDHLDGVNAVTNAAGAVVAKTSYLPFGEIRQGGQEKFSYTGKEKDKATDLYYFDSRFNSPELRHFTQADIADPDLDDPQDLNRYAYVGNNPLSYVDPDGHKKKKKAKLSAREKWMIAHGVDPDKDHTHLKKAKKQEKEGKKYTKAAKSATHKAANSPTKSKVSPKAVENIETDNSHNDEKLEQKKEEVRELYYAIKNNGTFNDSYQSQDNVCSDVAYVLNISPGARNCCIQHDNCYAKYSCNASSWTGNFVGLEGECNNCNSVAYQCIKKIIDHDLVGLEIMTVNPIEGFLWDWK
jgi:RHS repeat-associated protein